MIKVSSLLTGYGKKIVLHDINTTFNDGEFTCIIGPNSCGKSTFLKSLCNILTPWEGKVEIDGKDITKIKRYEKARQIAYLQQENKTSAMTVEQFVLKGRFPYLSFPKCFKDEDKKIAEVSMQKLGILSLRDKTISTLSGGMKQNVYIAMALCQDSKNLLFDEPTTYLDISNGIRIIKILKSLALQGKCIVSVIHDLHLAIDFADRILLMDNGEVVADGTPDEVINTPEFETAFKVKATKIISGDVGSYKFDLL